MIISYKNKFIFWKPPKTASTSVQCALYRLCGNEDIITPIIPTPEEEGVNIVYEPKNFEGFTSHITPIELRDKIDQQIWNNFFKITIVRNPWDVCVSAFWHAKHNNPKARFENYIRLSNERFIFEDCKPIADFYIRYENLENDLRTIFKKYNQVLCEIPKLKSNFRKNNKHYSYYYTDITRDIVKNNNVGLINYFGYTF